MSNGKLDHPDAARLNAFGLGQLDPAEAGEVERHVSACTVCCQTLWSLPDDQLVELLRQSFRRLPDDVHPPDSGATVLLPAELADHSRYRIVAVLGRGGMGVVYKAEHRLMERPVALKVIDRGLTDKPEVVERFRREVKAAAQLTHPNIVHAYDAEQAGDSHFLVMEFVEGTTLARRVEENGPLPIQEACDSIRQAALGLQRAWEHGLVHRDIKPHNLMLTPQGVVKVLDFGLARLAGESRPSLPSPADAAAPAGHLLTQMGMVMGTADYMAPEQATDPHAADIRADVYSLGCTLYYLLTGRPPFPEGTILDKLLAHGQRTPAPPSGVPAALVRVLERMMAKEPAHRYQTPAEVAEALRPFTAAAPRRRWAWPWRWAAALLVAGVVAIAAAVITVQIDKGEFVIETDSNDVAVRIDKEGVKVHDRGSNREYLLKHGRHRLPSGEYEIDVSELPAGIEMSGTTFRLKRGETTIVTARVRAPARILKRFGPDEKLISMDDVTAEEGGWRIKAIAPRSVGLYEFVVPEGNLDDCRVFFEAKMKSEKLKGKAYLEMWCHFPEQGESFSKGIENPVSGTTNWASYETPFFLQKGERPDRIKLRVMIEGTGTLWIKDIALLKGPFPAEMRK